MYPISTIPGNSKPNIFALLAVLVGLALLAGPANAQAFDVPFVSEIGCKVVQWMKGSLAIIVFIVTIVACLLIGMIAKMDWGRLISVTVIFGILSGIGGILANSSAIQNAVGLTSCLQ